MNFINAIKNHKKKFLSVILLSGIFYNTNKILRNEKGLRKLKQRFQYDPEKDKPNIRQILVHENIIDQIKQIFQKSQPLCILFPNTQEQIQKIIFYANKYNFSVIIDEIVTFQENYIKKQSPKAFVIVNLKNCKSYEFSQQNQILKVGTGWTFKGIIKCQNYFFLMKSITLSLTLYKNDQTDLAYKYSQNLFYSFKFLEINEKLAIDGYCIPISKEFQDKKLFEIINKNQADFDDKTIDSIRDLIYGMNIVLPDGKCLISGFKGFPIKSIGIQYNELMIGTNSNFGIVTDVALKVFRQTQIPVEQSLCVESRNFDQIYKSSHELLNDNECIKSAKIYTDNQNIEVRIKSEKPIDLDKLKTEHYFFHQCKIKDDSKSQMIKMKLPKSKSSDMFENLKQFDQLIMNFDLFKGDVQLKYNEKDQELIEQKALKQGILNQGIFIQHNNIQKENDMKSQMIIQEYGKNSIELQLKLKQLLDPNNIIINYDYLHSVYIN